MVDKRRGAEVEVFTKPGYAPLFLSNGAADR
jgi:hypothetical protein